MTRIWSGDCVGVSSSMAVIQTLSNPSLRVLLLPIKPMVVCTISSFFKVPKVGSKMLNVVYQGMYSTGFLFVTHSYRMCSEMFVWHAHVFLCNGDTHYPKMTSQWNVKCLNSFVKNAAYYRLDLEACGPLQWICFGQKLQGTLQSSVRLRGN